GRESRAGAAAPGRRGVRRISMQVGMVGLGRMGANMAVRLIRGGHEIVGYAADPAGVKAIAREGATWTTTLDDFIRALRPPRVAWVMVPAGAATEQVVTDLAKRMAPDDTIVDGGNSFYKDDVRRMKVLRDKRIHYVDVGTSGGVWGLERGYCLMIGGERDVVERLEPIFKTLAPGKPSSRIQRCRTIRASSPTPGKGGGRSWPRSRRASLPTCCRPRSTRASARARATPSPRRCSRPCARSSAATSSRRPEGSRSPRAGMILAGDVGGTKTALAL